MWPPCVLVMLLLQVLVLWWSCLAISQTMAVSCQVYSPDHTWATLPAMVNLRPSVFSWTLYLSFMKQGGRVVECVQLKVADSHTVSVSQNSGNCRYGDAVSANWTTDAFGPTLQTDIYVYHTEFELKFFLKSQSFPFVLKTLTKLPDELSVSMVMAGPGSITFNCPDKCWLMSYPGIVQVMEKSSTFFFVPREATSEVNFFRTITSCMNSTIGPMPMTPALDLKNGSWNRLDVFFVADNGYQVIINGKNVYSSPIGLSCFMDVVVDFEAAASWSLNCDPRQLHKLPEASGPPEHTRSEVCVLRVLMGAVVVMVVMVLVNLVLATRLSRAC